MAVLLPTTLPSTYEYVPFSSIHTFYSSAIFLTAITVTVSSVTVYVADTSKLLIVVGNNNPTNQTTGTFLGQGATIRISGWHRGIFDDDEWKYRISTEDATEYSVKSHTRLPDSYYKLFSYEADRRTTTTIVVTVQSSVGTFNLTQLVFNDWNRKRNLLIGLIKRGTLDGGDNSLFDTPLPLPPGSVE
jgi:hypothetical protein